MNTNSLFTENSYHTISVLLIYQLLLLGYCYHSKLSKNPWSDSNTSSSYNTSFICNTSFIYNTSSIYNSSIGYEGTGTNLPKIDFHDLGVPSQNFQKIDFHDLGVPSQNFQKIDFHDLGVPSQNFQKIDFHDLGVPSQNFKKLIFKIWQSIYFQNPMISILQTHPPKKQKIGNQIMISSAKFTKNRFSKFGNLYI